MNYRPHKACLCIFRPFKPILTRPRNATRYLLHEKAGVRPTLTQSDRWIEKGDFRSKTKSCILTQSKKCLLDPNVFDRAIRSAHPVEKVDFFNGMRGSNRSLEKVFEATHRITHHPRNTITPYNGSDAGLTANAAAAAAADHSESAWHLLFSTRRQRVPSSDRSSACYR